MINWYKYTKLSSHIDDLWVCIYSVNKKKSQEFLNTQLLNDDTDT